jgi:hypothetical protein
MSGSLLIAKRVNLHNVVQSHPFKMLMVSISVGILSGLFIAMVRLNWGLPGHKAFFWMTPVLIARLRGGCKIGTTAGGLFAALTTYSLGANLAGGVIGLPIIVLAGLILDWAVNVLEKNKVSTGFMILALGFAGLAANVVCLAKRMILPTGLSPHFIFGLSGAWVTLYSYMFFGFLSGIAAVIFAKLLRHKPVQQSA